MIALKDDSDRGPIGEGSTLQFQPALDPVRDALVQQALESLAPQAIIK